MRLLVHAAVSGLLLILYLHLLILLLSQLLLIYDIFNILRHFDRIRNLVNTYLCIASIRYRTTLSTPVLQRNNSLVLILCLLFMKLYFKVLCFGNASLWRTWLTKVVIIGSTSLYIRLFGKHDTSLAVSAFVLLHQFLRFTSLKLFVGRWDTSYLTWFENELTLVILNRSLKLFIILIQLQVMCFIDLRSIQNG